MFPAAPPELYEGGPCVSAVTPHPCCRSDFSGAMERQCAAGLGGVCCACVVRILFIHRGRLRENVGARRPSNQARSMEHFRLGQENVSGQRDRCFLRVGRRSSTASRVTCAVLLVVVAFLGVREVRYQQEERTL